MFLVSYAMSRLLASRNNPKYSEAFMGELPCVVAVALNLCEKYVIGVGKQRLENNINDSLRKNFESSYYNANWGTFRRNGPFGPVVPMMTLKLKNPRITFPRVSINLDCVEN